MSYISGLNTLLSSYSSSSVSKRNNRYKISPVKFKPKDLTESNQQQNTVENLPQAQKQSQPLIRISTGQKYSSHVASALLMVQEEMSKVHGSDHKQAEVKVNQGHNNPLDINEDDESQESQESVASYKDIQKKVNASIGYIHKAYNNTTTNTNNMAYNNHVQAHSHMGNHYNNFQFKNPVGNASEYPFPDSPLGERTQAYVAGLYMQNNNYLTANSNANANASYNMYSVSKS